MKRKTVLTCVLSLLSLSLFGAGSPAYFTGALIDLVPRVRDLRADGLMESIRGGAVVGDSVTDLKVGDIFIDCDGAAKKVVNIVMEGDALVIETIQPDIREVFLMIDIPDQRIVANSYNINKEIQPNVTPDFSQGGGIDDTRASLALTLWEKGSFKLTLNGNVTVTPGFSIGVKLPYGYPSVDTHGTWKWWKWSTTWVNVDGYATAKFDYAVAVGVTLAGTFEASEKGPKVPILGISTPSWIEATAGIYAQPSITGSLAVSLPISFNLAGYAGAKCSLRGLGWYCYPFDFTSDKSSSWSFGLSPTLSAEVILKQGFYAGCTIKLFGYTINDINLGAGPYVRLSGSLAPKTGSPTMGWSSTTPGFNFNLTDWAFNAALGVGVFAEGKMEFFNKKVEVDLIDYKYDIFTLTYFE